MPTLNRHDSPRRLPGDPPARRALDRALRVDHAGELGARRIYDGQLAVLGDDHPTAPAIRMMAAAETEHLDYFKRALPDRRVRPTLLTPVWHVAGYALGAATALLGPKAAMACTVAVEEVIDDHYGKQIEELADRDAALTKTLTTFQAEEREHRDTGLAHGAEETPGYRGLRAAIRAGCRGAIWLSERV